MKTYMNLLLSGIVSVLFVTTSYAQCKTWNGSPDKEKALTAHTIYRDAIKQGDLEGAFSNWKIAYDIAPAADGNRDFHYSDGIKIYLDKFENETDEAKQAEYANMINKLYDEMIECYANEGIKLASCEGDCYGDKVGFLAGRKAYEQFYTLDSPYEETLESIKLSMDKKGNDIEYFLLDPAATIIVYQFQQGKVTAEEARNWNTKLLAIADVNIAKGGEYTAEFKDERENIVISFDEIADSIFDCNYFKDEIRQNYDANPNDPQVIKNTYVALKEKGCTASDPLVAELERKYKSYANAENARRKAEFEANNPAIQAQRAEASGDYAGAIQKYDDAIAKVSDPSVKAGMHYKKAMIQFRKLNQYSAARASARKAAQLKSGWGAPYLLIGDMYARSARSCGDSWNQRLAIIAAMDKYAIAKSDPQFASDAASRIAKYRGSLPEKQDGFMRGVKPGGSAKVGCWIGETVKVRFK